MGPDIPNFSCAALWTDCLYRLGVMRRAALGGVVAMVGALAGCATPPPGAYVNGDAGGAVAQVLIGDNTAGESCAQSGDAAGGVEIFCGTWVQPSARLRRVPAGSLRQLMTTSSWRIALDVRFACEEAAETTILGGAPALVAQCTRRIGGWPHVALVAQVDGAAWIGDGVLPALPVMEKAIAIMSGRQTAGTAAQNSAATTLVAERLAARNFGAGDIGQYDQLIEAGTRANLADESGQAEAAFRSALAVQERALGRDDPNTVTPLTYLALQLSNQGRMQDAESLFTRAAALVARAADPVAPARLAHYRALHALNRGQLPQALELLRDAEAEYRRFVPRSAAEARPAPPTSRFARSGPVNLADLLPSRELVTDPVARSALFGLVEVGRYRALVLRDLGRTAESAAALRDATELARGNGLTQPLLLARLYRSGAMTEAAAGRHGAASAELDRAVSAFGRVLPGSKPVANTRLVRARQLALAGDTDGALAECRAGVRILTQLKTGTDPEFAAGCLDIFAAQAARDAGARQGLYAEMFAAAQVAQGGITSQQIAQATARLGENARDPRVADAIRARQDASSALAELYRKRDDVLQRAGATDSPEVVEVDTRIATVQAALAEADSALQAAAPNYGQLVQQVVGAATVQGLLRPGEAFVGMTLNADSGWVFLVRRERLAVARIDGGLARMADLVGRVRASIEGGGEVLPEFDTGSAYQLYAATLAGVERDLDGITTMSIAPVGPLLALPFDVLLTAPARPDRLAEAPWLLRRFTLAHVPSPGNFVSLRRIAGGSRAVRPWFGFGEFRPIAPEQARRTFTGQDCAASAQLLTRLSPLPFATRELEAARLLLGATAGDELLGEAFTAGNVLKRDLRDYRVLQFSTHALLPSEIACQTEPAIVTSVPVGALDATGALLSASQIASLNLDADLIVLSACNSGGPGGTVAGESLSGLARSFFYAGARALMVTHWAVNDQTAAYLVADTMRRLRDRPEFGIAEALRAAELGLLDGAGKDLNPEVAHPFYWAPFAVIGEGSGRLSGLLARDGRPAKPNG